MKPDLQIADVLPGLIMGKCSHNNMVTTERTTSKAVLLQGRSWGGGGGLKPFGLGGLILRLEYTTYFHNFYGGHAPGPP